MFRFRNLYNQNNDFAILQNVRKMYQIFNNYEFIIEQKNEYIKQLQDTQVINMDPGMYVEEAVELRINTTVKNNYIKYIQIYGVPEDGIFLQDLLDSLDEVENC